MPSTEAIKKQSLSAYNQWKDQWRDNAKYHSRFDMKDLLDFQNSGIGKPILCIANGYSFEENMDVILKNKDNVDIICVDKSLKHLLDHGIKPKFCIVCDANVDYKTYMEPIKDDLDETTLFINVCANPEWTKNGNWKDVRFFVNKDVLNSEREFCELSGCPNVIAAGTNVSNALIILLTQCDNDGRRNFFGYDKILLMGYDYSWTDKSYYAFDEEGQGRANYMKTVYCYDLNNDLCYTSSNLLFSAKWMDKYIKTFNIYAIQCSKKTLLHGYKIGDLEEQMKYEFQPEDSNKVTNLLQYRKDLTAQINEFDRQIFQIGRNHYKQVVRTT